MKSVRLIAGRSGFTLIELLLVLGIIALLAAVVIVAINPSLQLAKVRNTQRQHDIGEILNAFTQYAIDHQGGFQDRTSPPVADCALPLAPAAPRKLCLSTATASTCDFGIPGDGDGCVYSAHLVPRYFVEIPSDPQDDTGGNEDLQSNYAAQLTNNGSRMKVYAPDTEIPPAESVFTITR